MISSEDSRYTYSYKDFFKILPNINNWNIDKKRIKNGKKVKLGFEYSSDNNNDRMNSRDIKNWINKNFKKFN